MRKGAKRCATVLFAGLLCLWSGAAQSQRREMTEPERAAVLRAFAASYPDETVFDFVGDDLDGPFPIVSVTFRERERTPDSRLLQAVDCWARTEFVREGDSGRTLLRPSQEVWDCHEPYQVVLLDREIPPIRVSVHDDVPHELAERLLALARSEVGERFVTLTRIDKAEDGKYALHYTMGNGFGVRSVDPQQLK